MLGCRALTDAELNAMLLACDQTFCKSVAVRMRAQLMVAAATGLRVSELLALRVGDVSTGGRASGEVYAARRTMKGKQAGRRVPLAATAQAYLNEWLQWSGLAGATADAWLFPPTRCSWSNKPLYHFDRAQDSKSYRKALRKLAEHCGIDGKISTHSTRKRFAARVYQLSGNDLLATQQAMGHRNIASTLSYLASDNQAVAALIRQVV